MSNWKYVDATNTVVWRELEDGRQESMLTSALPEDTVVEPADPPPAPDIPALRRAAYSAEADPIFFLAQRGEATQAEWLSKIAEIRARYPMPEAS